MAVDAPGFRIERDAWLEGVLGRSVHRLSVSAPHGGDAAAALREHVASGRGRAFWFAKVPTDDIGTVRALTGAGMTVVDVNVTLEREAVRSSPRGGRIDVHVAAADEARAAAQVAGRAFRWSRFHLDPSFTKEEADRIKREWITSYGLATRGDRLFVSAEGGQVSGFLAALTVDRVAVVDLIGVDEPARGRGHARALIEGFAAHYVRTHPLLRVGTQIANVGSLLLYQSAGFVIAGSQYVLHLHRDAP